MRYIDRRFLFPVAAVTAFAQQQTPEAAAAEAALRARAQEFFQLQVDKKYRQAEAMVADDTKDYYYDHGKMNIKSFAVGKVELIEGNTKAKVAITAKVSLVVAGVGALSVDAPSTSSWKIENGQWVWYQDPAAVVETPFGVMTHREGVRNEAGAQPEPASIGTLADLATLESLVKVDRSVIVLNAEAPQQIVIVSNDLPGSVDLEVITDQASGFKAEMEKSHLEAGQKTKLRFTAGSGKIGEAVVRIRVVQLGTEIKIRVNGQ